jgi:hypothetical protein
LAQILQKHVDLRELVKLWPDLPEPVRKQIIDAVRAALKSGGPAK